MSVPRKTRRRLLRALPPEGAFPTKIPEHPYVLSAKEAGLLLASGLVKSLDGALIRLLPGFVVEGEHLGLDAHRELVFRGLKLHALETIFDQLDLPPQGPTLHEVRVRLMSVLDPGMNGEWSFADERGLRPGQPVAWRSAPLVPGPLYDPEAGWHNRTLLRVVPDQGPRGVEEVGYRIERPDDRLVLSWCGWPVRAVNAHEGCVLADGAMRDNLPIEEFDGSEGMCTPPGHYRWDTMFVEEPSLARKGRAA